MRLLLPLSLIATPLLTACGTIASPGDNAAMSDNDAALLAKRLKDRVAGQPQKCVSTSQLGQPVVYGSATILYSGSGGTEYRNDLMSRCPGLDDDDLIVTEIHGSQLCSGDAIRPVDRFSGIGGPVCRLGEFLPYTKAKNRR